MKHVVLFRPAGIHRDIRLLDIFWESENGVYVSFSQYIFEVKRISDRQENLGQEREAEAYRCQNA